MMLKYQFSKNSSAVTRLSHPSMWEAEEEEDTVKNIDHLLKEHMLLQLSIKNSCCRTTDTVRVGKLQ